MREIDKRLVETANQLVIDKIQAETDKAMQAVLLVKDSPIPDSNKMSVMHNANDWISMASGKRKDLYEHYKFRSKRNDEGKLVIYSNWEKK